MKAKKENIITVCINDSWGFTEKNYPQLRDLIDRSKPDYWSPWLPSLIFLYFLFRNDGVVRANAFIEDLSKLVDGNPLYTNTSWGKSIGDLIAKLDRNGNIQSEPMGIAINEAMQQCRLTRNSN